MFCWPNIWIANTEYQLSFKYWPNRPNIRNIPSNYYLVNNQQIIIITYW